MVETHDDQDQDRGHDRVQSQDHGREDHQIRQRHAYLDPGVPVVEIHDDQDQDCDHDQVRIHGVQAGEEGEDSDALQVHDDREAPVVPGDWEGGLQGQGQYRARLLEGYRIPMVHWGRWDRLVVGGRGGGVGYGGEEDQGAQGGQEASAQARGDGDGGAKTNPL